MCSHGYFHSNLFSFTVVIHSDFSQLETLKYTVDRTGKDLEAMRERCSQLKKEVVDKHEKYIDS